MKKTTLASAITLSLAAVTSAQAATISITSMAFSGIYAATGTLNDAGNGYVQSIDPFFYQPWSLSQTEWFDTHSSALTWSSGTSSGASNAFTYTFHLTDNQVAAGLFFDWNTAIGHPILIIFDCPVSGGGACTGVSEPMATGPFVGSQPGFNGTTADDFPISGAVPVPAALWLMASGLLGLVGMARRKTQINSRLDDG